MVDLTATPKGAVSTAFKNRRAPTDMELSFRVRSALANSSESAQLQVSARRLNALHAAPFRPAVQDEPNGLRQRRWFNEQTFIFPGESHCVQRTCKASRACM